MRFKRASQIVAEERKPSIYIPTLYFAEGLPYTIVNLLSVVFFKGLGATNQFIGLTSFLYIPWTIKLFWAPLVDLYGTKRNWIVVCQILLGILVALMALGSLTPNAITISLVLFALIAMVSATHDIAIDGYYLDVLETKQQAFYVGIRNAAYKVAWLLGSGGLVYLAGKIGETAGINVGWAASFGICAALFLAAFVFHYIYLPHVYLPAEAAHRPGISKGIFFEIFSSYFKQPAIWAIVTYILIFRLGDALMLKMAQPFLLDPVNKGGLAISTADVGIIYGTVGMVFLLLGGIIGGWLVSRDGLKKWLWPTALIQNSAILLYWALAVYKPGLVMVAVVNSIEQFSYGLGVAAYTVFLLSTVKPEFKAAHYAIATAFMALGVMLPGAVSGYLQAWLGYSGFFLLSFMAAIPGLITIFFLPIKDPEPKAPLPEAVATEV